MLKTSILTLVATATLATGALATEQVALNFQKIKPLYTVQADDHSRFIGCPEGWVLSPNPTQIGCIPNTMTLKQPGRP